MSTKKRTKRSIIWTIPRDEMEALAKASSSITEMIRTLNLNGYGKTREVLKERLIQDNIPIPVITREEINIRSNLARRTPLSEIFKDNSSYARNHMKKIVIRDNLIPYVCCHCGNNGNWNNKNLVLQLDHINGKNNDNRLENLRFLCPNCHSQTETFGKKSKLAPISSSALDP